MITCNLGIMMNKNQIEETLSYWIGISECDCSSEFPTGGCLKCDLEQIQDFINKEAHEKFQGIAKLIGKDTRK